MAEDPERADPPPSHHLNPLNHVGRNLLQSIDTSQGTEDRTVVEQNLRVGSLQTIDTHLLETTVLAVILHTYPRLEVQTIGQGGGIVGLKHSRIQHIHQRRSQSAGCLIPVGRHHDTIQ